MMTQRHNDKPDYEFSSSSSSCIPCVASCTGNTLQNDFFDVLVIRERSASGLRRALLTDPRDRMSFDSRATLLKTEYPRVALKLLTTPWAFWTLGEIKHSAPLSTHYSPLSTHCSPLSTYCSPLSTHCSPLSTSCCPLFSKFERKHAGEW